MNAPPDAATVTLPLPFGMKPDEARLLFAIKLFEEGEVSLGYAAEMTGYSYRTFVELLEKRGVAAFGLTDEADWAAEVATLEALRRPPTPASAPRPSPEAP